MLNYIVPVLIAIYGAYQLLVNGQSGMDSAFLIKNGGITALGVVGFLWQFKDVAVNYYKSWQSTPSAAKTVSADQIFLPTNVQEKDFACLVHLKNRVNAANSEEGKKVVDQLNTIIFSLGDPVDAKSK